MAVKLFFGEETYLLETRVKKIKKDFGEQIPGINYIQIDESNVEQLISDIETPAFGFSKKLIIAKNTQLFKKEKKVASKTKTTKAEGKKKKTNSEKISLQEKIANYLLENKQEVEESIELIFIEQEVEKNNLYQAIEQIGEIKEIALLKLPEIVANLKKICSAYQVTLEDSVAKYLVESCRNFNARFN